MDYNSDDDRPLDIVPFQIPHEFSRLYSTLFSWVCQNCTSTNKLDLEPSPGAEVTEDDLKRHLDVIEYLRSVDQYLQNRREVYETIRQDRLLYSEWKNSVIQAENEIREQKAQENGEFAPEFAVSFSEVSEEALSRVGPRPKLPESFDWRAAVSSIPTPPFSVDWSVESSESNTDFGMPQPLHRVFPLDLCNRQCCEVCGASYIPSHGSPNSLEALNALVSFTGSEEDVAPFFESLAESASTESADSMEIQRSLSKSKREKKSSRSESPVDADSVQESDEEPEYSLGRLAPLGVPVTSLPLLLETLRYDVADPEFFLSSRGLTASVIESYLSAPPVSPELLSRLRPLRHAAHFGGFWDSLDSPSVGNPRLQKNGKDSPKLGRKQVNSTSDFLSLIASSTFAPVLGPLVGLVYDQRMLLHEDASYLKSSSSTSPLGTPSQHMSFHEIPPSKLPLTKLEHSPHPERPDRLRAIAQHLVASGCWKRCVRLPSRVVTREELLRVHSSTHVAQVEEEGAAVVRNGGHHSIDGDTYLNRFSLSAAALSCGSLLSVVDSVLDDQIDRGVALIRPPGHHAEPGAAMGFCIYNNIAVAAAHARARGVQRVLIVDWDVHHGNGTENAFYEDPSVLFFSLHRHENGQFYPGTGHMERTGAGAGAGYNINVPWRSAGMGDAEYIAAFDELLMPVAREFDPQLVLISCGFDAAEGDPLGENLITPAGYAQLTSRLLQLAGGRVVVALEGGYNLTSISRSMEAVVRTLLGAPPAGAGVPPFVHSKKSFHDTIRQSLLRVEASSFTTEVDVPVPSANDVDEELLARARSLYGSNIQQFRSEEEVFDRSTAEKEGDESDSHTSSSTSTSTSSSSTSTPEYHTLPPFLPKEEVAEHLRRVHAAEDRQLNDEHRGQTPAQVLESFALDPDAALTIALTIRTHAAFWPSLRRRYRALADVVKAAMTVKGGHYGHALHPNPPLSQEFSQELSQGATEDASMVRKEEMHGQCGGNCSHHADPGIKHVISDIISGSRLSSPAVSNVNTTMGDSTVLSQTHEQVPNQVSDPSALVFPPPTFPVSLPHSLDVKTPSHYVSPGTSQVDLSVEGGGMSSNGMMSMTGDLVFPSPLPSMTSAPITTELVSHSPGLPRSLSDLHVGLPSVDSFPSPPPSQSFSATPLPSLGLLDISSPIQTLPSFQNSDSNPPHSESHNTPHGDSRSGPRSESRSLVHSAVTAVADAVRASEKLLASLPPSTTTSGLGTDPTSQKERRPVTPRSSQSSLRSSGYSVKKIEQVLSTRRSGSLSLQQFSTSGASFNITVREGPAHPAQTQSQAPTSTGSAFDITNAVIEDDAGQNDHLSAVESIDLTSSESDEAAEHFAPRFRRGPMGEHEHENEEEQEEEQDEQADIESFTPSSSSSSNRSANGSPHSPSVSHSDALAAQYARSNAAGSGLRSREDENELIVDSPKPKRVRS